MCGRYARARSAIDYVVPLALDRDPRLPDNDSPSWNARPQTSQPVIYPDATVARVRWGYLPAWQAARKGRPLINAKSEKLLGTWKALARRGRVIVPGDCWYEWVKAPDGGKQPYAIRRIDGAPLWMAGLCSVAHDAELHEGDGFQIVTALADAGLVDVHDRRPVVFDAAHAREWLEAGESAEAADALAREAALPAEAFTWYPVSRDVNASAGANVHDAPYLVEPLDT